MHHEAQAVCDTLHEPSAAQTSTKAQTHQTKPHRPGMDAQPYPDRLNVGKNEKTQAGST